MYKINLCWYPVNLHPFPSREHDPVSSNMASLTFSDFLETFTPKNPNNANTDLACLGLVSLYYVMKCFSMFTNELANEPSMNIMANLVL